MFDKDAALMLKAIKTIIDILGALHPETVADALEALKIELMKKRFNKTKI